MLLILQLIKIMEQPQLTAVILTLNEARHITACIESLRWADHILVVDSYSCDATVNLARQAGAAQVEVQMTRQDRRVDVRAGWGDQLYLGTELIFTAAGRPSPASRKEQV